MKTYIISFKIFCNAHSIVIDCYLFLRDQIVAFLFNLLEPSGPHLIRVLVVLVFESQSVDFMAVLLLVAASEVPENKS